MANADGTVLPKPGIPKTLGILNVIFGVLLILYGLCTVGFMVAAPALASFAEKTVKDVQAKSQEQQKARLQELDDREKAAKSDEEKKSIQEERKEAIANPPAVPQMNMSGMDMLKDPVLMGYTYTQLVSGVLLSLVLLGSGIGLIRLAPWGRSTAIAWAALQLVQLVGLSAVNAIYVQPVAVANQEKLLAKAEADAKAPNAAPGTAEGLKLARAMSSSGAATVFLVGFLVAGSIYPIVVLTLLNNPGARAALLGPKPDGPSDF